MSDDPSSKYSLEFQPKYPPTPSFSSWASLQVFASTIEKTSFQPMPSKDAVTMSEYTAPYPRVQLTFLSKTQPLCPLFAGGTRRNIYGSRDYLFPLKELTAGKEKTDGDNVK